MNLIVAALILYCYLLGYDTVYSYQTVRYHNPDERLAPIKPKIQSIKNSFPTQSFCLNTRHFSRDIYSISMYLYVLIAANSQKVRLLNTSHTVTMSNIIFAISQTLSEAFN